MGRGLGVLIVLTATAVLASLLPTVAGVSASIGLEIVDPSSPSATSSTTGPAGADISAAPDTDSLTEPPAEVLEVETQTQPSCDAPAAGDAEQSITVPAREIVTTFYCRLMQRPPDAEGLDYWSGQLDGGMNVYDLYVQLTGSGEFQARQIRTSRQVLAALQLSPERHAEREQRALAAEARLQAEAEEARRASSLRVRTNISAPEFVATVERSGLQSLDFVTDAMVHGTLAPPSQRINVTYVHLSETRGARVSPGTRGRSTVGTWAEEIGAQVAINGNWYAPWDGPAVSGGVVYAGSDHGYTSLFGFTAEGDAIIEHHREINDGVDDRIVEGVSGHPTLVHRGELTTDFGTDPTFLNRNPRTAIGLDETGDVLILVTVDGRSSSASGMTGQETADLMAQLGAHDAVMLDGGGSSTMWIAGRGVVNRPSGSLRAVGNQIAVFGD